MSYQVPDPSLQSSHRETPFGPRPKGVQAVILAAGRGSRLDRAIRGLPKCLAKVAGVSLIDRQIALLRAAGIDDIAVVTGYRADAVRAAVGDRAAFIHNPAWASTNSLCSLHVCRDWVTGPFIVLNCDVLLDPQVLPRLLRHDGNVFAFDSSSGNEDEHMKVELRQGYLAAIDKALPSDRVHGENVGLLYFDARAARRLFEETEALMRAGATQTWLAAAVQRLAPWIPLRGVDIADLSWIEIDFPHDLDKARRSTWPRICSRARLAAQAAAA